MSADEPFSTNDHPMDAQVVVVHVRVEGRVQGVGFRYYVLEKAQALGVRGWVRNRWDESVEILAQGERNVLERFIALVQRGPRSAFVSRMEADWQPPASLLDSKQLFDFHIRPTE
jgi:acylphosphatase